MMLRCRGWSLLWLVVEVIGCRGISSSVSSGSRKLWAKEGARKKKRNVKQKHVYIYICVSIGKLIKTKNERQTKKFVIALIA